MEMFYILDSFCSANEIKRVFSLVGNVFNIAQIVVPVIIILFGTIDLVKAIISNSDDNVKKSQSMFIKRLIYGVAIFFILPLVKFLMGLIGQSMTNPCMDCFLKPNDKTVCNYTYKEKEADVSENGQNNIDIEIDESNVELVSENAER